MLGESREEAERRERGFFARWLKTMPWCDPEVRAHSGYESDCFAALIDSDQEPPQGARTTPERWAWRKLVWASWRIFTGLQRAKARLAAESAAVNA